MVGQLPQLIAQLPPQVRPQIWHQTGRERDLGVRDAYRATGVDARVEPFIEDMAAAYRWSDLVLARAGAMTVAEVAAAGVAAVLVPFPYASDDHQTRNAAFLAQHDAALAVPETELAKRLPDIVSMSRDQLIAMAQRARTYARVDATEAVADICEGYLLRA